MTPDSTQTSAPPHETSGWKPHWSPEQTNPDLPPITVINDPDDLTPFTTSALAARHPARGRITIHPTPLATAPAYLAHDLIRALGKHLPTPSPGAEPPWWTANAGESWRIATAWTQALHIHHYVLTRAHRIPSRHYEHLMALREHTAIHLTLIVSGPTPPALHDILTTVQHHHIDTTDAARAHLTSNEHPATATPHPWWNAAPFPPSPDEYWFQLPPRPHGHEACATTTAAPAHLPPLPPPAHARPPSPCTAPFPTPRSPPSLSASTRTSLTPSTRQQSRSEPSPATTPTSYDTWQKSPHPPVADRHSPTTCPPG
ncbi:hypothetical protein [Streptomyces sp. NBC_00525]|uniref:hypothetical protein n=1 Tax=Streptomyces sp. NBC_00525 TaxID=2903660 RepID=UPI002E814DF4|nr:hypothetical protein [Streptomyces sp. NBC_00525]WUC92124.1 hypothetical protein OG710_00185 [Streptomyces sp. NBC_00525]WUC97521.1 hypothetical protein OG710_29610 [Streptomyces sp. NBC_00525]